MKKTGVLIVEDEVIIARDLAQTLTKLGYLVVGHCVKGEDAIDMVEEKTPDIVLMDIMLKGDMTGIDAAKEIRKKFQIPIVYLTAYSDEDSIGRANSSGPSGYLVKPFKANDLRATIETALYRFNEEMKLRKENEMLYHLVQNKDSKDILFVKSSFQLVKVIMKDILYVEALKDYVTLHTISGKYIIRSTMKGIQEKLPTDRFVRVHRSFIVRIDKIISIDHTKVILEYNKDVPVGGLYKEEFLKRINTI
ncbi:MAG TPA: response regulator [Bacteroidia bacterium]|jgi:DNA-binding LytR/AlgR family response regulator|nr:response regulator [Bacteroidia bacterium]